MKFALVVAELIRFLSLLVMMANSWLKPGLPLAIPIFCKLPWMLHRERQSRGAALRHNPSTFWRLDIVHLSDQGSPPFVLLSACTGLESRTLSTPQLSSLLPLACSIKGFQGLWFWELKEEIWSNAHSFPPVLDPVQWLLRNKLAK